jgi:hypothetical protein
MAPWRVLQMQFGSAGVDDAVSGFQDPLVGLHLIDSYAQRLIDDEASLDEIIAIVAD